MSNYHGKEHQSGSFGSEGTSFVTSPLQSPLRPVYFVQTPSRESHDDEKHSFHSSPEMSPSISAFQRSYNVPPVALGHENGQRVSYNKPGSRKIIPQPSYNGLSIPSVSQKKGYHKWNPHTILEEEEQQSVSGGKEELSRFYIVCLSILVCILIFLGGALIFWLACQPHSPKLTVEDIAFFELEVVPGTDGGVPTQVLSTNCTLTFNFHNPSKYFGVHVSPSTINLMYQELLSGTGQVAKFYQSKNSISSFMVSVTASKTPLYGAGPSLQSITDAGGGVPLQIQGVLESHAYVFWKIIKPKFHSYFSCNIIISSSGITFLKLLQKTCSYQ